MSQDPHFLSSELQSSSQPSSELPGSGPLQSPKPAAQTGVQTPPLQARELTLLPEQGALQDPQWATVPSVSTSQPLSVAPGRGPSQSPQPFWQAWVHCPDEQVCELLCEVEHAVPQAPQCAVVVLRLVSQPLSFPVAGREQLPQPESHEEVQRPPAQVRWFT